LAEIRHLSYDVGIDLLNLYPPAHPLFFRAGIPLRIGYTSGGFGPLLSRPIEWQDDDRAMADHYRDLLDAIDPARPFAPDAVQPRRAKAAVSGLPPELAHVGPYVVLHPGAGADFKDWGLSRWHELADRLRRDRPDLILVFTGAGQTELAMTAALAKDRPGTIDMAGRVDWEGFVSIVAHAALVICPDTATGHVAALFDVPTISLFTGTNKVAQWRPYSDQATVLVQPVLCSPCNRSGCEAMACLRQTTADDVMATVANVLPPSDHR
jgi:ADP-heptose:LPS heptosyltransferase